MATLVITIDGYVLDVVYQLRYLGVHFHQKLSLKTAIKKRIGKAAKTLTHLSTRLWTNPKLTVKTKMASYNE